MEIKLGKGRYEVTVKENLLDKVIRAVDPIRGKARLQARAQTAIAGGYNGASKSRRQTKEYSPTANSADTDTLPYLTTLRARSRDMGRNTPLATGAINTVVTSVVGPGLTVKSSIDKHLIGMSMQDGMSDDDADEWERHAERLFRLWSMSEECDSTRTQTFFEYQSMVFRSVLESGDIFVLLPSIDRDGSPFRLKLQAVEADRVENGNFKADSKKMSGGVEIDENGAPSAYHILKDHPGDFTKMASMEWQVVRAFGVRTGRRNVLHLFDKRRPGQTRGVPYLAPVIETLKMLDRYTEAELMAAVVAGLFTVFVKTEETDTVFDLDELSGETGSKATDDDLKLASGAIAYLGENEDITTANPNRPNVAFDPFVMAVLRQVGVALEIPFELLIKHFTASYSASRAALLEAWRFFKTRRAFIISGFCQPVYEAFITEQVARGRLQAPGFFEDPLIRAAYLGTEWRGRPQGHIQPLQEANAAGKRIDLGISTIDKESAELDGGSFHANHNQRARETKKRVKDGIVESMYPAAKTLNEKRKVDDLESIDGADAVFMPSSEIPAVEIEQV